MGYLRHIFFGLGVLALVLALLNGYYYGKPSAFNAIPHTIKKPHLDWKQATYPSTRHRSIKMDMDKRNSLVRKFCAKHQYNRTLSETEPILKSRKLYVDDKHKFIYCHMPKIATTTWLRVLMSLNGDSMKERFFHKESHARSLANYTTEEALHRVRTYFKFVFVRDPFERFLSAYKDKFLGKRITSYITVYAPRIHAEMRRQKSNHGTNTSKVSFPELVRYLSSQASKMKNQSYLRQQKMWDSLTNVCQPCTINYDFIGHYETLGRDARFVLKKIGVHNKTVFPPWKANKTSRKLKEYYGQLSKEERTTIHEMTKEDCEMFGYTPIHSDLNE